MKLLVVAITLQLLGCNVLAQLLRPDVMNLGVYNPETKHYESPGQNPHVLKLIGQDDHDKKPHAQHLLGGGDHDMLPHHRRMIGGDDHDFKPHAQHLLGGGDHDLVPHHRRMIGGDDHDLKPHAQHLLGGGDHDKKPHGHKLIGGDDHDLKPHKVTLLGSDDHDLMAHRLPLLGRGDHDNVPHGHLLGRDGHGILHHGSSQIGGGDHDYKPHGAHLLGGGDHDKVPHGAHILGGGDHDKVPHGAHLLGGGDHDRVPHHRTNLGGDDHDKVPHGQQLGGGDHDYKPHGAHLLGRGDHDRVPHHRNNLGGDDHDKVPHKNHASVLYSFRAFMQQHNKQYSDHDEFKQRFSIFRQNMQRVRQLQRSEQGTATYGVTKFSDLTEQEFSKMLGFRSELRRPSPHRSVMTEHLAGDDLPVSFDWREHGAVTPIKNQGACGSCWAFSTTGNVEGQWAIKNKQLIVLSEQELVDCDPEDHGCEGGLPENAYDAIKRLGGLESEEAYPYNGYDGTCHMETEKVQVKVNGSLELPQDEDQLARWLLRNGPISIGINAMPLQFYHSGVSHPMKFLCNPKNLDHGMLLVGFGMHTTKYLHRKQPYWIIKNSWGTTWGEKGYYRVFRGDGTCGLNLMATSSIVL